MKKQLNIITLLLVIAAAFTSCKSQKASNSKDSFAKGADVGWLPQMEATGYKFYDTDGSQKDCLQLLKDRGINTIRLRVWVNPNDNKASGHCSPEETVVMAVRAKKMGMRIMTIFTTAIPGQIQPNKTNPQPGQNILLPNF